jgi:uncharacterized protein (TIGR02117 family)
MKQILTLMLSFIILSSILGCSDKPAFVQHTYKYSGSGKNKVYIVNHGWHTGFVIPSDKLYEFIPTLKQRLGQCGNIEIGWGDKAFYQAEKMTLGLALNALLWPTETVIHAVAVPHDVSGYFSNSEVVLIYLNDKELSHLITFISNSFHTHRLGDIEALGNGIYGDSQFYKGAGEYHIMNTCNEWTAKGLKSVGMEIIPAFKLTAESIMNFIRSIDSAITN